VQAVIRELRGEKIDIVQYDDDATNYVRNALNPAAINRVAVKDYDAYEMEVIVAEDQLSLAIGRRGQNVRLAGKLVGWNLDIKSEIEKKAEVEAEMERMASASQELASLPDITEEVSNLLLDAGFRAVEEVCLASMDDLSSIEGIDEETAIDIHDSAERWLEEHADEIAARAEAAAAEAAAEGGDTPTSAADLLPNRDMVAEQETAEPAEAVADAAPPTEQTDETDVVASSDVVETGAEEK